MRNSTMAALVISVIAIASVAAYGAYSINSGMFVKPTQEVQVSNYSAANNTLQPQISSLNNNITSLGNVTSYNSNNTGKSSDSETKINLAQQQVLSSSKPVMILDRSSYYQGDTIHISAAGLDAQTTVTMQILDSSGFASQHRDTTSDSSGKMTFDFPLSLTVAPGTYTVRIIEGQTTISQPISILSSGTTYSSLNQFTAHADKGVYRAGDIIGVSGIAQPSTAVNAVLTSPSGLTYTSSTTAGSNGAYAITFSTSQGNELGNWYITLTNQGQNRQISTSLGLTSSSSGPGAFTAQAGSNIYSVGNSIVVSGTAQPSTAVNAVLTSPSGLTYTSSTTAGSNGAYAITFSTSQGYETGNWYITLTNQGQSRLVSTSLGLTSSSSGPGAFTAQAGSNIYSVGNSIVVSGTAQPYTSVNAVLTSPSGLTYTSSTTASSSGSYAVTFSTSQGYETGNWYITLTNQGQSRQVSISLGSTSSSSGPGAFTAQAGSNIYIVGNLIGVTGSAQPYTSVNAVLTSPSGLTYTSSTTASSSGSYAVTFSTSQGYETGNWYITLTNQGQSRQISIFLGISSSTSGPGTFTAQAGSNSYNMGDLIVVTGTVQPSTSVNAILTSPSGLTYTSSTTAGTNGAYAITFSTSQGYETGNWYITLTNQGQSRQVSISLGSTSLASGPGTFTANTDKTIYVKGTSILITGTAPSFSNVSSSLTGPSGATYNGAAMTNFDGSYNITYLTSASFETGNWHITLHSGGLTQVLSIFLQP